MNIDLNCDLGEGAPHDADLMPLVTSANIACGGHAGDEGTMRRVLELARACGVAPGAHPGYADRENFGRKEWAMSPGAVHQVVREQVQKLRLVAASLSMKLTHVKPHGALYNQAARDRRLAGAIADAIHESDPQLVVFGLAGSELITAARARGLRSASEIFADRRYEADGSLIPRSHQNAFIEDPAEACAQVLRLIHEGRGQTVCIHGDAPGALTFAQQLRAALQSAGFTLARPVP